MSSDAGRWTSRPLPQHTDTISNGLCQTFTGRGGPVQGATAVRACSYPHLGWVFGELVAFGELHEVLPAGPDGLPAGLAVVFTFEESPQTRDFANEVTDGPHG